MRNAETILGIIRERGNARKPLEDVYRQLYQPALYLKAYARIYKNDGALTKGTTQETVDGMSMRKIEALIEEVRQEKHRWTPVRRTYIPKKNGVTRPLGIPTWMDKLLQEVIRMILEAYYESQMSERSHGFRPERGCHTALMEIRRTWTGTKWFIEGDIKGCFDHINHDILMERLSKDIHDKRFLRLIRYLLKAGYLEDWKYNKTLSGTPQGGIVSPILANIYLDILDQFVEHELLPMYNKGEKRELNATYQALKCKAYRARKRGDYKEAKRLLRAMQQLPSVTTSQEYRRLHYVRYADDFLLGFAGPKEDAEEIKSKIATFLATTMKLELSPDKTLITHASTDAAKFLGYEITVTYRNDKLTSNKRSINGNISLRVPQAVVQKKIAKYSNQGKPCPRRERIIDDDFSIIDGYQAEYRGLVQYYKLAGNITILKSLNWFMETSLLKTLAWKHQTTKTEILRKYKATVSTPYGPRKCLQITVPREGKKPLIARFGGIPLIPDEQAHIVDSAADFARGREGVEIIKRLLADKCELCGSKEQIQVHHIRRLADLQKEGRTPTAWAQKMAARRRKTLVVCQQCHVKIHAGTYQKPAITDNKLLESRIP